MVTKADKGGKVVDMDVDMYVEKMNLLLNEGETYNMLRSNPLKRWQQTYNRKLKSILFQNFPDLFKRFQSYLPSLPYMYGLPKLHKDGVPMRPITSTNNSVTYRLSSWLANLLSPCLGTISNAHVKDS